MYPFSSGGLLPLLTYLRALRPWLALPLLLMLLLSACATPTDPVPKGPSFTGKITLWGSDDLAGHPGRLEEGWLAERARLYEAAHPGIIIEIRSFDSGEALEQALLGGSELPDLALGRALPTLLSDKRAALPLPAELVADHGDGALAPYRYGDGVAGLPLLLDTPVLLLNSSVFASRSVPLPEAGRWSDTEFVQSVEKLSGNGPFGLGFSHAPGYHQWWGLAGGLFTLEGKPSEGADAGLIRLAQWRKAGLIAPEIATATYEESLQRFAAGEIAMLPIEAWAIPLLRSEPYQATFAVAGFPGDRTYGYAYGLIALSNGQAAEKLQVMADLAAFLSAPDQQVRLARKTGLMPARKSAPNPFDGDPQLTQAFQLAGAFQPLPAGPAWDAAQGAIADELLLALYGGKAPAEALDAARAHLH